MTHPSTFDHGSLTRCTAHESIGDLGDVWDTQPDVMQMIFEGPRTIETVRGDAREKGVDPINA
jgi:hypothetical protein